MIWAATSGPDASTTRKSSCNTTERGTTTLGRGDGFRRIRWGLVREIRIFIGIVLISQLRIEIRVVFIHQNTVWGNLGNSVKGDWNALQNAGWRLQASTRGGWWPFSNDLTFPAGVHLGPPGHEYDVDLSINVATAIDLMQMGHDITWEYNEWLIDYTCKRIWVRGNNRKAETTFNIILPGLVKGMNSFYSTRIRTGTSVVTDVRSNTMVTDNFPGIQELNRTVTPAEARLADNLTSLKGRGASLSVQALGDILVSFYKSAPAALLEGKPLLPIDQVIKLFHAGATKNEIDDAIAEIQRRIK